jgi:hypothetical protein
VDEPAPSAPLTPPITLRAGTQIATDRDGIDDGIWFREATRLSTGTAIRSLLVFAFVIVSIVRSSINGEVDSFGEW